MAERDFRIDLVVEFSGPTDFFGPFVQEVTEEALRDTLGDLPGLEFLNDEYIRRSPICYADRLPQLQVHHGTADETVPLGEAERPRRSDGRTGARGARIRVLRTVAARS